MVHVQEEEAHTLDMDIAVVVRRIVRLDVGAEDVPKEDV